MWIETNKKHIDIETLRNREEIELAKQEALEVLDIYFEDTEGVWPIQLEFNI